MQDEKREALRAPLFYLPPGLLWNPYKGRYYGKITISEQSEYGTPL